MILLKYVYNIMKYRLERTIIMVTKIAMMQQCSTE